MDDEILSLGRKTAVITGASSGLGMATALEFAKNGYNIALAARRLEELQDVARQCEEYDVTALPVLTDTSNDEAMHDLRQQAVDTFGRIDVWVNNAGVYMVGKFESLPMEDMRRLMDVNFFGYLHGSHTALQQFREQGYGTLINISSVNAAAAMPYISLYSASKAAVRALDESLRMELILDGLGDKIHICTAMPATMDTNIFQNAANYSGHEVRAIEPVYDPEYVAKKVFDLSIKPRREKFIGPAGTLMAFQRAHSRGTYERQVGKFADKEIFGEESVVDTHGNLHAPLTFNRGMRGGWQESQVTAKQANIAAGTIAGVLVGLIGLGIIMTKRRG